MILLTSKDYCTLKSPRTSEYECVRQGKFACVPYINSCLCNFIYLFIYYFSHNAFPILPCRWITPAVLRIFAESYAIVPGPGINGDLDVWSSKSPLKLPPHGDSRLVKSQLISSAVFTALFAYMIVAPHCRGKALLQNPLISTTYLRPFKCLRPLSIL